MNERIKELYIQAAQEHRATRAPEHGPIDEPTMNRILDLVFDSGCGYRFVELIIQDCAQACLNEGSKWRGEQDITDFKLCAQVVKQHFGIES